MSTVSKYIVVKLVLYVLCLCIAISCTCFNFFFGDVIVFGVRGKRKLVHGSIAALD